MFKRLYIGELKKLLRPKTAIIILSIILVLFIVVTLILNIDVNTMVSSFDGENGETVIGDGAPLFSISATEEDIDFLLASAKSSLETAKKEAKDAGYKYYRSMSDPVYVARTQYATYQYIKDNELYNQNIPIYVGTTGSLGGFLTSSLSAEDYVTMLISTLTSVLVIYGLIVGSGAFATEMRGGTLKLLMLRPVSRNKLHLAKLLATLTIVTGAFLVVLLLVMAYGFIRFDSSAMKMLFVFNSRHAFMASSSLALVFGIFQNYLQLIVMTILAFTIGTLTKNRVLGIALPYATSILGSIIVFTGLSRFFITSSIQIFNFFSVMGSSMTGGSNFFISLPVLIIYVGSLIATTFLVFNRRDIA